MPRLNRQQVIGSWYRKRNEAAKSGREGQKRVKKHEKIIFGPWNWRFKSNDQRPAQSSYSTVVRRCRFLFSLPPERMSLVRAGPLSAAVRPNATRLQSRPAVIKSIISRVQTTDHGSFFFPLRYPTISPRPYIIPKNHWNLYNEDSSCNTRRFEWLLPNIMLNDNFIH